MVAVSPRATWRVERLVPGGEGLCRLPDGRAGFVPGGLPGDDVEPTEVEQFRGYARAQLWNLVTSGPNRVTPPCPVAERCGGCDLMALARGAQPAAKAQILGDALRRIGKFRDLPGDISVVTAGPDLRYRSRLRLHVDDAGQVGLFGRRSHSLVPIEDCLVGPEATGSVLRELRAVGKPLADYAEVELRVAPAGPCLALRFEPRAPSAEDPWLCDLASRMAVTVAGDPRFSQEDQRWPLPGGVELHAPPDGFTQINWSVNLALVEAVVTGARQRHVARFCDLYCGSGNFALPLLAAGIAGLGIDAAPTSIAAAERAARAAALPADGFAVAEAGRKLAKLAKDHEAFDLVLLDPPRTGAREVLAALCQAAPRHVAVCSCDPATLARDLRSLVDGGYQLTELCAFDMFPHTHHVESLVWLEHRR
jgi:23S rRNA (uracil1939-C5)-methyltransferase